jgi:indolepyruvate ferredoxin oxidoreductase, alpha subunit
MEAANEAMNFNGPAVIVFRGRCVGITKSDKRYKIDPESCTGCSFCIKQLGCPALVLPAGKDTALIQDSCSGCGLCAQLCPLGAIHIQEIILRR